MNQVSFKASVHDAFKFLKKYELLKQIRDDDSKIGEHSDEFKKASRNVGHIELHKIAIKNLDYEALLFDDSIFQFGYYSGDLRYAFIQNPQTFASKMDYVQKFYSEEELLTIGDVELKQILESIDENEYEQYLNEQNFNIEAHTLRYDLDEPNYKPLKHAYSHIHIGLNENLRIACSKILTPLKFTIFAIKNTYYKRWKETLDKDPGLETQLHNSKNQCIPIPGTHWINKEKFELFLD